MKDVQKTILSEYRKSLGLTKKQVSETSGINQSTYIQIENMVHSVSVCNAYKLAKLFNTNIEHLFNEGGKARTTDNELITTDPVLNDLAFKVSYVTGINTAAMKGKTRKREVVQARQLFYYFAYDGKNSLSFLGGIFGQDHSTVSYARKEIPKLAEGNKNIYEYVDKIEKLLKSA